MKQIFRTYFWFDGIKLKNITAVFFADIVQRIWQVLLKIGDT